MPGWEDLIHFDIGHFICPSDNINEISVEAVAGSQPATAPGVTDGIGLLVFSGGATADFGRTNYVGSTGFGSTGLSDGPAGPFRGMITSRQKSTLEVVSNNDGTANTVMFAENIGSIELDVSTGRSQRTRAFVWTNGCLARGRGSIGFLDQPPGATGDPRDTFIGNKSVASVVGFGTMHPAGINLCFGDASVHNLTAPDRLLLMSICGAYDAQTQTIEDY